MPSRSSRAPGSVRELLFVYGTLMRGQPLHPALAPGATFVGRGYVRGRLLDLGPYPGLIDGTGRVRGEIYRIDASEVLLLVDREEGYNFDRRRTVVTFDRGRRARAWVYRYSGTRMDAASISEGDWRRARGASARLAPRAPRNRPTTRVAGRRHS